MIFKSPFTLRVASEFKYKAPATSLSPLAFSVLIVKLAPLSTLIVVLAFEAIARAIDPVPIPLRFSGFPLECGLIVTLAPFLTSIVAVPRSTSSTFELVVPNVTSLFSSKII